MPPQEDRPEESITPSSERLVDAFAKDREQKSQARLRRARTRIRSAFERGDAALAERLYQAVKPFYPEQEYLEGKRLYEENLARRRAAQELREAIDNLLAEGADAKAMELHQHSSLLTNQEFLELKAAHVRQRISADLKVAVSEEQARAIARDDTHLLLHARAGSGKTTTLACKAAYLMQREGVLPEEMLLLAFNRKAAGELRKRIRELTGHRHFKSVVTFHGLAHRLVSPAEKPLFDEPGDFSTKQLSMRVQRLMRRVWSPTFWLEAYKFFRKEIQEIDRLGLTLSDEDYYLFRRNLRHVSLRGERVKSNGEKFIADFLLEHGIPYGYEQTHFWDGEIYRPDFTIFSRPRIIVEHWGIDHSSPGQETPGWWTKTREEYLVEIENKRRYWKREGVALIETGPRDLLATREQFEAALKARLEAAGCPCKRLADGEIQRRLEGYHRDKLTKLFVQFIQQAKKRSLTPAMTQQLAEEGSHDERTSAFLRLASRMYRDYQKDLRAAGDYDFDDLLADAIRRIEETQGKCAIRLGDGGKSTVSKLRWIFIDEYQDFSKLFYHLISTIRKFNPDVRLFCVGDDWQAINGFAGSDLDYFHSFAKHFPEAGAEYLLTNRRSLQKIVDVSNEVMIGLGEPATHLREHKGGEVHFAYVDDIGYVEEKYGLAGPAELKAGRNFIAEKYLKQCYEIGMRNPGGRIAVLARIHRLFGVDLEHFGSKLAEIVQEDSRERGTAPPEIRVSTVHAFKGLEDDVVVVLNACNGAFPLIHPDSVLFVPLGQTYQDILEEERRLFYVALTRARRQLWIVSEKRRESDFLIGLSVRDG